MWSKFVMWLHLIILLFSYTNRKRKNGLKVITLLADQNDLSDQFDLNQYDQNNSNFKND